ncbi:MAG: tetratricopeptide repeat protein [Deltaproteobacteria bacterium]
MKQRNWLTLLYSMIFLSGCAAFQVGSDVEAGRKAFLIGNNQAALGYFQRAAETDPNYVYFSALPQNVWSYVGRSEYATGRLPQARQTLEKSLSISQDQDVARLYLGMTLARGGERQQGVKEIESGMKGIYDRIEYISQHFRYSFGAFYDTRREIRSSIEDNLAMISGKDVDLQRLIADSEWLGKRVEEEINWAQRDEREERLKDASGRGQP